MKNLVLLLIFTFGIKSAFADCTNNGMQYFPAQKEVSLNSMFIIQGYAQSQRNIISFKSRTIYLESDSGDLIKLVLQGIFKGQKSLTQAIFKPAKELKPNTTYFLKYKEKKEREKVFWKTTDKKYLPAINSNLTVEFEKTEVAYYGCGPSAKAIFNIKNKTEAEIWYKTEVVELSSNKKTTYYIKQWNEKLSVGHSMCSGAFTFNLKGKYNVRFTPMNTDGKTLKTTEWKTFESPFTNS